MESFKNKKAEEIDLTKIQFDKLDFEGFSELEKIFATRDSLLKNNKTPVMDLSTDNNVSVKLDEQFYSLSFADYTRLKQLNVNGKPYETFVKQLKAKYNPIVEL